jgi:carbon-monoxide dehydrogenase large subunit
MTVVTPKFGMGASVLRLEDQTFITGKGRYTDDIAPAMSCARPSRMRASR